MASLKGKQGKNKTSSTSGGKTQHSISPYFISVLQRPVCQGMSPAAKVVLSISAKTWDPATILRLILSHEKEDIKTDLSVRFLYLLFIHLPRRAMATRY